MRAIDVLRQAKYRLFPNTAPTFPVDAWGDPSYEKWFFANRPSESELETQKIAKFNYEPLFSIIVPLFKTPIDYLSAMAESVLAQTYGRFELILVNASPEDADLMAAIEAIVDFDPRVKEVRLDCNYGIAENTNRGIEAATGDFLCFLDHDDFLEPNLLFEYAKAVNEQPNIDVLYCDEDMVEVDGSRIRYVHPLFKPAYSPELLLCKNYIIHMMAIRSEIARKIPKPDSSYDGAQDYNMILRSTNAARRVFGVQKVLYHWRISEESTAANPHAKPYSRRAYRKSAFARIREELPSGTIVSSGIINIHNVWFDNNAPLPVSIVVDCNDDPRSLTVFLEELEEACNFAELEIVPVTKTPSSDFVVTADVTVRPMLAVGGNRFERLNAAVAQASGDYVLLVSSRDVLSSPKAVEQLVGFCMHPEIGVVAAKCLYADNSVKSYGIAVTPERIMPLYRGYPDEFPGYQCNTRAFQNASAVSWQGMMVEKELFRRIGGFSTGYQGETVCADFGQKVLREGLRIVQTPTVKIQTNEMAPERRYDCIANSLEFTELDLKVFDERWPGVRRAGDPFFSGNFDQASEYCQIPKANGKGIGGRKGVNR